MVALFKQYCTYSLNITPLFLSNSHLGPAVGKEIWTMETDSYLFTFMCFYVLTPQYLLPVHN